MGLLDDGYGNHGINQARAEDGHKNQGQNIDDFPHLKRWLETIAARPATVRAYAKAKEVNPNFGQPVNRTEEERKILDAMATTSPKLDVEAVITQQEILEARKAVDAIHVADPIRDYIVSLVLATRGQHPGGPDLAKFLQFGASPRATINLTLAAKAWAFLQGRDHVTPQDVKDIAPDVLRHRLILTYEADAEGVDADAIVRRVLDAVSVP